MSAAETVTRLIEALERKDFATAADYLTDNFTASGWTPRPLDKRNFLIVIEGLKDGFPNLIFNLHDVAEHEHTINAALQVTGTQINDFILPPLSLPPIPETGNSVSLPVEPVQFILQQDRIEMMNIKSVAGGGIQGLIHQLGVDVDILQ